MRVIKIGGTILAATGALLLAAAAGASDMTGTRTKEQCTELFHHLNASGTGKLTLNEAAGDASIAKELDDPLIWKNGYVTVDQFTPLCMGGKGTSRTPQ
jgi:hypothetical protein